MANEAESNFQISTSVHMLHAKMVAHVWIFLELTAVIALMDGLEELARVINDKLIVM